MNNQCDKNIGIQSVEELPIWSLEQMPEFILGIAQFTDQSTGEITNSFVNIPAEKLFPAGNLSNAFPLQTNNPDLTIPENGVLPIYVENQAIRNVVLPANGQHKADALAFQVVDGTVISKNTGVIEVMGGHGYIVGTQYYLAANGGVTTNSTQTGQRLFKPLSKSVLAINMSY